MKETTARGVSVEVRPRKPASVKSGRKIVSRTCNLAALAFCLAAMALPAFAADVTPQRLLNTAAEPQNWLMVHRDYNNSRHSPLKEINATMSRTSSSSSSSRSAAAATGGTLRGKEEVDAAGRRRLHVRLRHLGPGDEVRRAQRHQGGAAVALRSQDHASRAPIAASRCTATRSSSPPTTCA